jgi:mycothiol synthase
VADVREISDRLGIEPADGPNGPQWWAPNADGAIEATAHDLGLVEVRRLHQMRRPLPLEPELLAHVPPDLRPFRPGIDDDAWLATNNRAFAWHPEQGGWDRAELERHLAEPWFEADGFLLLDDRDGGIAAFCWTKHHADHDPPMGEVYVIGVDPAHHGTGLGRALTVAGLAWQWEHHRTPIGVLWVEHDNTSAVALYDRLGFTVHADDLAFALPGDEQPTDG